MVIQRVFLNKLIYHAFYSVFSTPPDIVKVGDDKPPPYTFVILIVLFTLVDQVKLQPIRRNEEIPACDSDIEDRLFFIY